MTPLMQLGGAMGMTRMNMAELLGSMFRRDAASARRLGLVLHLMNGVVFGLAYALVWWGLDPALEDAWWLGLIFGGVHSVVAMVMMPVMSSVHPRVGPSETAAPGEVVLPRFGFGGAGFGSMTPVGILMGPSSSGSSGASCSGGLCDAVRRAALDRNLLYHRFLISAIEGATW